MAQCGESDKVFSAPIIWKGLNLISINPDNNTIINAKSQLCGLAFE
jgi:hypothetical protein